MQKYCGYKTKEKCARCPLEYCILEPADDLPPLPTTEQRVGACIKMLERVKKQIKPGKREKT